jgi:hypothetical protein
MEQIAVALLKNVRAFIQITIYCSENSPRKAFTMTLPKTLLPVLYLHMQNIRSYP